MGRWRLSLVAVCAVAVSLFAGRGGPVVQAQSGGGSAPYVSRAVRFAVSPTVSEMADLVSERKEDSDSPGETKPNANKIVRHEVANPDAISADPVVQSGPVILATPAPDLTFEGLSNANNAALFGFQVSPPDTVGDVGPNHYVQMTNLAFRVFDKAGNPLTPPKKVSSLFSSLGGACATRDDGDPIVLWDPLADRWILTQFCTIADPFNHQVIAISKTPDPTGEYYLYDFVMPNNKFNDYPKFGVWPDAYYMTDNQFNQAGTAFLGAGVFAFDRLKMLVGDPSASYIYFDVENGNPNIGGLLPSDLDGLAPPPPGTPNYFMMFTADEFGDPQGDGVRIWEFRPDFATPAASTFTELAPVPVASFDPRSPAGRDDIEQPPPASSSAYLDAIADRLMHRLAYRNFGTHESLVVNHTVNVTPVAGTVTAANHQAAVRYYEFRRALPGGAFTIAEQATFAPDTDNRWMGSAAMDGSGNIAVGYSVSSLTTFPAIRYAARLASDPPGGLFQGETTLQAGSGVQTGTGSRWGDYSAMSVDPADDCTFWYTNEYYTAASQAASSVGWLTRIGKFTLPSCTPVVGATIEGYVRDTNGVAVPGALVQSSDGFVRVTDALGYFSMGVPAGTYALTGSRAGFLPGNVGGVVATAGNTTSVEIILTGIPVIVQTGAAVLVAESCGVGNGAVDPGESVTVALSVANTGQAATTNLVGTLVPIGGVTSPGPSQSFGAVAPGATVSRNFTFVADSALPCGAVIQASLQLQDGALDLGTFTYPIPTGTLNPYAVTSSISSGDLNVPIPDVNSVEIPIVVTDLGAVQDMNVKVRLNHTFTGDLEIRLIAPDGTSVLLFDNRGGGGDNLGAGANNCSGTPTVFDDEAGALISAGTAPFAGSFRPEQALSALDGKQTAGTWRLRVTDTAALDTGTVFCVQLEIARRLYTCCGISGTGIPQAAGFALTGESCNPNNGVADPDETVTVDFALVNAGSGDFGNLVATLLPTGGIATPSGPQSYGPIVAGGPPVSRAFTFVPQAQCGQFVTATLQLQDGATDLGTVDYLLRLGTTVQAINSSANAGSITIPNSGAAVPYPSTITVAGIAGTVARVRASLTGLSHTFPGDIDILLVGPGGQNVVLMSDVGGGTDAVNVNLTFDDDAASIGATIVSGTFRPTNSGTGDTFPAPAPAGPHGSALSVFNGVSPNGVWSLYVVDDAGGDLGSISGGWSLQITTSDPVCCSQACSLTCPSNQSTQNELDQCGAVVNYPGAQVVGTCGALSYVPPSGSFFPLGTTPVSVIATRMDGATTTCGFSVAVTQPTTVALAPPADTQYSDVVTLSAAVTATRGCFTYTGVMQFYVNGAMVGSAAVTGDGTYSYDYKVTQAAGSYPVEARFISSTAGVLDSTASGSLNVLKEDAIVTPSAGNPVAVQVSAPGGTAGPITLSATVEDSPDGSAGDIALAAPVTIRLEPVVGGGTLTCAATLSGSGSSRTATCVFPSVPVNVYDVSFTVGGNYYTGSASSVLSVYDPSLGFATGGGTILRNGVRANFGFSVRFVRSGNAQGSLLYIEHRPDGVVKLKSNAMGPLSLVGNSAVFTGKATLNGVGNHGFRVTAVDNGQPGSADQFGLQVTSPSNVVIGDLTFAPVTLSGGNIQVPQPSGGGNK